jgi:DNA-binding MarR family transcriptional regulator
MNRATDSHPDFTPRQGQYLAFIHAYTLVNGRPPAQADIQRFFRLTPPSVHQMLLTLERARLISRRTAKKHRRSGRSLRLSPAGSRSCSTGQNHWAGYLDQCPAHLAKLLRSASARPLI